jgi:hypothetical protein
VAFRAGYLEVVELRWVVHLLLLELSERVDYPGVGHPEENPVVVMVRLLDL